jgi:hypothetical protein
MIHIILGIYVDNIPNFYLSHVGRRPSLGEKHDVGEIQLVGKEARVRQTHM